MKSEIEGLIRQLAESRSLPPSGLERLIDDDDAESAALLAELADRVRMDVYGDAVFIRGLIEISSFCKNDCFYCGLRRSNAACSRYRLTPEQILACADAGHELGFRTFVMQGGEDAYFTDEVMCGTIREMKRRHPDCAVTLSLGERSAESFRRMREAGADRYLLRHETANEEHYKKLHPSEMSFGNRMECLRELKSLGYQTGCGFMVGSPFQTSADIVRDLKFIEEFRPEMCGIGPFIPHRDTPFGDFPVMSPDRAVRLTCRLLSVIRLMLPAVLLPATTALSTLRPHGTDDNPLNGRAMGLRAGANVIMPNLSPPNVRGKYELYNNKLHTGAESAQKLDELRREVSETGYRIEIGRGDSMM